jgi:hypothetical protein
VVAVAILIGCIEYAEGSEGEIFGGRGRIKHYRFMILQRLKEFQ